MVLSHEYSSRRKEEKRIEIIENKIKSSLQGANSIKLLASLLETFKCKLIFDE
jgi:hypothetical protein